MSAVQKLYEACQLSLCRSEGIPPPQSVELVKSALDDITSIDVGLEEPSTQKDNGYFWSKTIPSLRSGIESTWAPPITYVHLHEKEDLFSMGIFCLPAGACIPLHNHPGMTVFSKVLYGSMHVRSFDWAAQLPETDSKAGPSKARLAYLVEDHVITAPFETEVLYPAHGNIHSFTAVTSCAVLDILAPPYSTNGGRRCTFYKESRVSCAIHDIAEYEEAVLDAESRFSWLQETQSPKSFVVKEGIYKGPKLRLLE